MRFKFIEKRPVDKGSGFIIPNEELSILREFVSHTNPTRAAAICSGGEVPLTVLLPVCQEVVAVDHSKVSLAWACVKALMMEKFDGNTIIKMFLLDSPNTLWDLFRELIKEAPDAISMKGPGATYSSDLRYMSNMWRHIPAYLIDQARERLENLTIIHGDLRDLEGEYDLLYTSNATEHQGHDNRCPTASDFLPVIKKDGHLLHTHTHNGAGFGAPQLELKHQTKFSGPAALNGMTWNYYLHAKV